MLNIMHRSWTNPIIRQSEVKYLSNFRNENQMRLLNNKNSL